MSWSTDRNLTISSRLSIIGDIALAWMAWRRSGSAALRRACDAMFALNRHARCLAKCAVKRHIYDLKSPFLRMLYDFGYCRQVQEQEQILTCSACGGSCEYVDEDDDGYPINYGSCRKCAGTGIYAIYDLYCFTFVVQGQRYSWHQPANMVDWPVKLSDSTADPVNGIISGDHEDFLSFRRLAYYVAYVWLTLRLAEHPQPILPGFAPRDESYRLSLPFPRGHYLTHQKSAALRQRARNWWGFDAWWPLQRRFRCLLRHLKLLGDEIPF